MSSGFVPLDKLFLSQVIKNNTNEDGSEKDPRLLARMQNPICQRCHEQYKKKYPNQAFSIKCSGVYDQTDYDLKKKAWDRQTPETPIPMEEVRENYDTVYWAEQYISYKDDDGNIQPFKARWYQEEPLRCTANRKVDRMGRGLGKALALDTPIPSPTGWKTMGDLRLGDIIFDADGETTKVTFVTEVMYGRRCYDVVFSDGAVITADAEHLWETWDRSARKAQNRYPNRLKPRRIPQVRTTEEIKATLKIGKKQESNHSVLVAKPLQYPQRDLPIDPYVLGVWLGDGSTRGAQLACNDQGILDNLVELGVSVKKLSADFMYAVGNAEPSRDISTGRMQSNDSLRCKLRDLGVKDNKHIPLTYSQASIEQRLSMLRGLMDTDGNIREDGWAEFDNTNRLLAESVFELICSLGMKPSWSERDTLCHNNGNAGQRSYRVGFFPTMSVFHLSRKASRLRAFTRPTVQHRYIAEIRERDSVPVRCITVDNPRHLYLAGKSCIPTHNTITGVIEELHKAFTNQKYEIMVVCPADSQTQKWFTEIKFQISNSPALKASLANSRQQPFKIFEFHNGSTISLFTAGSKSGRGADSVRGQDPRRVRLDEQDYLADKDYQAIMPLVQRHKNSEFHGASTPTGARQMFWEMCVRNPEYKEFYFPASVHPDWSPQREASCIREAKTMDRYRHEFLAEFGDPESGVFKGVFIDVAKKTKYEGMDYKYAILGRDATRKYFMGVDWNGAGTGTKIRIIEYDPETHKRRVVAKRTVDDPRATMFMSMEAIRDMNRQWRCESIFIDYGFGAAQDEMIREMGNASENPLDKNLMKTRVIDFGGTLEFNKLVSARGNSKYINNDDNKFERRTKPFMVDGVVMALESGLFEFSGLPGEDELLEEQMRAYKVKTYSNHGYANTYEAPIVGDHDLDATMLAMLACEMKYGLFQTENTIQKMAHILRTGGFGIPAVSQDGAVTRDPKDARREAAGIPRRNPVATQAQWRTTVTFRNGAFVAPVPRNGTTSTGGVPSRTSAFRNKPKNRGPFGW